MNFWTKFMEMEKLIVHHLRLDTPEDQAQALRGVEIAGELSGYNLLFQVGINLRNGKKFAERKNSLELIISPNWDRTKVPLMEKIYDSRKDANLPEYWSVVKYQVFAPSFVYDLKVSGVTHEDFEYCSQINFEGTSTWLGLLVFIKDELADKILTLVKASENKNSENKEDTWILDGKSIEGRAPLIFLNSSVGEFNMITRIKAVEFAPAGAFQTVPRYSISDLHQEFEKIDRQNYSAKPVKQCIRCGYHSYQVDIYACDKCKKIYYCDAVCQKADSKNHKHVCHSSVGTK
jgi:hypothetical protein